MMLKLIAAAILIALTNGCLEFILEGKDDSVIIGRSMEFTYEFDTSIFTEPAGISHDAKVPDSCGSTRKVFTNQFKVIKTMPTVDGAAVGITFDGMNSNGLSVSALYLPGYSKFELTVPPSECDNAVSQSQITEYILSVYGRVKDVRDDIRDDKFPLVWGEVIGGEVQPCHYSITDETGDFVVLEYTPNRGRVLFNNTIRVMTNSPNYDWHMTNLKNYIHLSKYARGDIVYNDEEETITPLGAGSGLLGVPGDFTPPSRFIRAVAMVQFSGYPDTATDGVNQALHILNSADITKGVASHQVGVVSSDYTFWIVVKELKNRCMYYRGYKFQSIRRICLSEIPKKPASLRLEDDFLNGVEDMAGKLVTTRGEL